MVERTQPRSAIEAAAVERRAQQIGHALLRAVDAYRPGVAERLEDWLLTRVVADDRFRTRLLRYMDVLASLDHDRGGHEAKRLAAEYFDDEFPDLPRALRWLLRVGRDEHLPAPVVGETARRSAEVFARRFITPPGDDAVHRTLEELSALGRHPSFDLLGEAVLSEHEAADYADGYLRLLDQLAGHADAGRLTPGGVPRLQVSLKLSSLTSHFSPIDPEGTVRRVRPPLEAILERAERAGVGVTVDVEQYEYRDLTWTVLQRVLDRGERFGGWTGAGMVVQSYLRDAEDHTRAVIGFAERRGAPFQVRLVKGAYWDYETIVAAAGLWPVPVFRDKANTDWMYERLLRLLIAAGDRLFPAVASHNARSHAVARAIAEDVGLPPGAIEHQTLFRTAEGMSRGLVEMGWVARDYVPVGELLPGMAYLVRRVLENSSQAGFLLQSRSGAPAEELLRPPPAGPVDEPPDPGDVDYPTASQRERFQRAPTAPWFSAEQRDAFATALEETRSRFGEHRVIEIDGVAQRAHARVPVHSPSHPGQEPIGYADFAGPDLVDHAVSVARHGLERWAAMPVGERAAILRRAARRFWERRHEFAASVVHEGGRDRAAAYAEVEEAIDFLHYYAERAERLYGEFGGRIAPRGVVAVIPPWNFSVSIPCGMTSAALVTGNAAILKPAEQTPLIGSRLAELLHEAGVPRDVLICLPGEGEIVGAALAQHAGVGMIAFTGSRAVGTQLHEIVSREPAADGSLRTLVAEMGGKNPILVFADADLDEAVSGIISSAFGHANQRCSAASRVLVERPILERLQARLLEAARSLDVGPADDPSTQVNPVIDREAYERLAAEAVRARRECDVLLDLTAESSGGQTLNLGPMIVELTASRSLSEHLGRDEIFGPILVLIPFDDEDEAYAVANGTPYGLTAGVFSRSPETVRRAAQRIEAGNIYVNRSITGSRVGIEPFGGMWLSGTGPKAGGPDYLWAFVRRTDARVAPDSPATGAVGDEAALRGLTQRWEEPFDGRAAIVERAAAALERRGHPDAARLRMAVSAAREEIARRIPTHPVAGQRTDLRYDTPRGLGLIRTTGEDGALWLAAALLAGNACAVIASPALEPAIAALLEAGVDAAAARSIPGGADDLIALAGDPAVAFAATDSPGESISALYRALGPTHEGQRSLKQLISPLDGPQPGETGFVRRFAWAKTVAVRTLRHGADLALGIGDDD